MQAFVTELVTLKPDCILGHTTPIVKALMRATETIPIVFVAVTDPIGSNIVASRGRPGGNITGFAIVQATMAGKYLSILREFMPQLSCVAIATIRTNPAQRRIKLDSRVATPQSPLAFIGDERRIADPKQARVCGPLEVTEKAIERLASFEDVVMIGDDVEADVGGAMAAGLMGILVQTGKYRPGQEAHLPERPTIVAENLKAAVYFLLN